MTNASLLGPGEPASPASLRSESEHAAGPLHILAPLGRDAALARETLEAAGVPCAVQAEAAALPEGFAATAGALLLTEEGLTEPARARLREALAGQPAWSDVPLVVLVNPERSREQRLALRDALRPSGDVTLLERPLRPPVLVAVVQSVLRDRHRQHEVQHLLAERERAQQVLEQRVGERTADLRRRSEQVRRLAASLTAAEQKERERIAGVLHDEFQQLLYGLRLRLQTLQNGVPPERESELLSRMDASLEKAIGRTRTLASELNPPALETEGFAAALPRLADRMSQRYGLHVEVKGPHPGPVPHRERRVLLFRLTRELLFNVARHAETDRATLTTHPPGEGRLVVTVEDEGAGFDPDRVRREESGFGLFSMQKRLALFGGAMQLDTAPGEGTRVTLTIPTGAAASGPGDADGGT